VRWDRLGTLALGRAYVRGLIPRPSVGQRIGRILSGDFQSTPMLINVVGYAKALASSGTLPPTTTYLEFAAHWDASSGEGTTFADGFRNPTRMLEPLRRREALVGLSRLALVAARLRADVGRWPDTLEELRLAFPEGLPLDPYTDLDFRFDRLPDGVRLTVEHIPEKAADTLRDFGLEWVLRDPQQEHRDR
jgi:hypothetical protein